MKNITSTRCVKTLLAVVALALAGCSSTNISQLVAAAAKDPAAVHFEVTSIYGRVVYERANPGTNSISVGNTGITTKP